MKKKKIGKRAGYNWVVCCHVLAIMDDVAQDEKKWSFDKNMHKYRIFIAMAGLEPYMAIATFIVVVNLCSFNSTEIYEVRTCASTHTHTQRLKDIRTGHICTTSNSIVE